MSDVPEETKDQAPEPTGGELLETANWNWGDWLGFARTVWTHLCMVQGVSEICLEPAPAVPEAALRLPEGHCDRCIEAPFAVWLRFRKVDMLGPKQAQMTFFDELIASPTVEALLTACEGRVRGFFGAAANKARSTIIRPGPGNGQQLGPGVPKKMRNLRFTP